MSGAPLVSIVIPTYNQADLLREALDSVRAQTFGDWEAIVVNNHSTDHTRQVVEAYGDPRFTLIDFANHGIIAASRNVGIGAAKGEWVSFLDSDDGWYPDKLAKCLALATEGVDVVTHREHILREGKVLGLTPAADGPGASWKSLLLVGNCFSPSSTLVRRHLLERLGGFAVDPTIVTAEDYDLWLRLALFKPRLAATTEPLGFYRLHSGNSSAAVERHLAANLEVVRRHGRDLSTLLDRLRLRRAEALQTYGASRALHKGGFRGAAARMQLCALARWPFLARGWAALALTLLPSRPALNQHPIRVAINGLHAKSGGGVTYLRNIMPLMALDKGLELHLFLDRRQYPLFPDLPEQIRLHLLDLPDSLSRLLVWEQVALPVLLREMKADVTFSPANYGPLAAPRPVVMLRNALSVVQWETRLSKRIYWIGLAIMTALSLLTARRCIAVSRYARDSLPGPLRALAQRQCDVIHHGIDPAYSPSTDSYPRGNFLLAVSDIYVQKNLHGLIEALALVSHRRPNLQLQVAGQILDPDYHRALTRRIAELGLESQVTFLGSVPSRNLPALYRGCRAFIFPSTVETFGNPLVEAMACGAPIVCSNTAAMPEILGDAGLYFNPTDVADMAAKIEALLADDDLARRLSHQGRERAGRFSWETCAQQTAAVITTVART